jgi:hypothetical protein
METTFDYLRSHATELGSRILETYPPLQGTKDPVASRIAALLRKALPAQALAITGTAKYLRKAKSARIVAECGAGKTYMALGAIQVLADGRPSATLVMCPSHITHKWAREALLTVPRARTFLIEDMRNGGDPKKPHGICEVKMRKGRIVYDGMRLSLAELRRMGHKEWRKRCSTPAFFITGKDKGKLGYYWEHAYLKAKSGPNLGGVINPDTGAAIMDSERQKLTHLDFVDKIKLSESLTLPHGGTTNYSALWQADRNRIQRMAPIEYIGRYMGGWFDFAIADELHQLAGDTAQGNGLGVLGRAAKRLIALTGSRCHAYRRLSCENCPRGRVGRKCEQCGRRGNRPISLFSLDCVRTPLGRRLGPCPGDKRIEPVLPALDPLCIVALGSSNRFVAEQLGYFLQRDALFKQIHGERVPEPVAPHVPIAFNSRRLKSWNDKPFAPISGYALFRSLARPEEVDVVVVLDRE